MSPNLTVGLPFLVRWFCFGARLLIIFFFLIWVFTEWLRGVGVVASEVAWDSGKVGGFAVTSTSDSLELLSSSGADVVPLDWAIDEVGALGWWFRPLGIALSRELGWQRKDEVTRSRGTPKLRLQHVIISNLDPSSQRQAAPETAQPQLSRVSGLRSGRPELNTAWSYPSGWTRVGSVSTLSLLKPAPWPAGSRVPGGSARPTWILN
jgi:hypothetical protein